MYFVAPEVTMLAKVLASMAVVCLVAAIITVPDASRRAKTVLAAPATSPGYTTSGEMLPPANYREWLFLTSGIDMNYSPKAPDMPDHSVFENVFVNPEARSEEHTSELQSL